MLNKNITSGIGKFTKYKYILIEHDRLRKNSLNLLASENILSLDARSAMIGDMAGRYSSSFYGGTKYIRKLINETEKIAMEVFNCNYAIVTPISGHMCVLATILAFTNINGNIAKVSASDGGYPLNTHVFDRIEVSIPFDQSKWSIDYSKMHHLYESEQSWIDLTILGESVMPFPIEMSHFSKNITPDQLVYDASHVLGLIAGGQFQNPLDEGAGVMFGSTHKSFFGPQGGIILTNDLEQYRMLSEQFSIQNYKNPFTSYGTILVDNVHANRIAALGISLLEMQEYGKEYAKQVIANSKTLGKELHKNYDIINNEKYGASENHQVIFPTEYAIGIKTSLEEAGIFVDSFIRFGTAEVTRKGMKEKDMEYIAELIHRTIADQDSTVKSEIEILCNEFKTIEYCFK